MGWASSDGKSKAERGYGKEWSAIRQRILKRDGYLCQCEECRAAKRVTQANEVHHIVSIAVALNRGWSWAQIHADSNLAAINHECHKRETFAEQGKVYVSHKTTGRDGWPV